MILTVTPNPCLDKTLTVAGFSVEKTNRATLVHTAVGGKGINVAVALSAIGGRALCTGFDFCDGGASPLTAHLDALSLAHDFVKMSGSLRCCNKIFDSERGVMIELNERGEQVTDAAGDALLDKLCALAADASFVVLSGSLPQGLSADFYARSLRALRERAPHCRVVVDAAGESLLLALAEHPFLIKPNAEEFAAAFGCDATPEAVDVTARRLIAEGQLTCVCVSLGGKGAYFADASGGYFAPALPVAVRSLQGAGDAMVAGLCYALERGLAAPEVLACGVATASAAVSHEGTAFGSKEEFEACLAKVCVQEFGR